MSNKQISKVIVYYTDGSFEEITKTNPTTPYMPAPLNPYTWPTFTHKCMVCGGDHGANIPCPNIRIGVGTGCEDPGR
jgi:hypothetical protein